MSRCLDAHNNQSKMYEVSCFFVLVLASAQSQISLEYKPVRPFHHPKPGNFIGQIIPPGKPWPSSVEGYQNFSQLSTPPQLEDRLKETTTQKGFEATSINLGNKPNRPPFHPNPGSTLGQIVAPGQPWPSKPEDYQSFSQTSQTPILEDRLKETTQKGSDITSSTLQLENKPNRPPFHPNPGSTLGQIVPPGQPWPSKPEDYQNFSQTSTSPNLEDRIKETTTHKGSQITSSTLQLGNKPNRPPVHPNPGSTLSQIIPPGKPWPSKPSQISHKPSLADRIKETHNGSDEIVNCTSSVLLEYKPNRPPNSGSNVLQKPGGFVWEQDLLLLPTSSKPSTINLENKVMEVSTMQPSTTPFKLEYKPTRPFHHPKPGVTLSQIVPSEKPCPDRTEGYQNFSQISQEVHSLDKVKPAAQPWPNRLEMTTKIMSGFWWERKNGPENETVDTTTEKPVTGGRLYTSAILTEETSTISTKPSIV